VIRSPTSKNAIRGAISFAELTHEIASNIPEFAAENRSQISVNHYRYCVYCELPSPAPVFSVVSFATFVSFARLTAERNERIGAAQFWP
jgi:hypothetical protein